MSGDVMTQASQMPHQPTFRGYAVNTVAVVPLLTTDAQPTNASSRSFQDLMQAMRRHAKLENEVSDIASGDAAGGTSDVVLVVPNSNQTQPGNWRYNESPLKAFHWQHGCQRLHMFDGRPSQSRHAHDRLMNQAVGRDWIDLLPRRRTAAVVGVLNLHDCKDSNDLQRAEEELHMWANRFATPPYEVTAHGRDFERDKPVERLFVFDSFDEVCQVIDLNAHSTMESTPFAFPPYSPENLQMLDVSLNVGLNDLAVAIFRDLEDKIKIMDAINLQMTATHNEGVPSTSRRRISNLIRGNSAPTSGSHHANTGDEPHSSTVLSLKNLASLVNPESKLARQASTSDDGTSNADTTAVKDDEDDVDIATPASSAPSGKSSSIPQLLTPLDEHIDMSTLSAKDVEGLRRRDMGRRVKRAADLALLAGAPLDAYERYLKAAQLTRSGAPDPLWYSFALIGCAAAHIAMAEAGGYAVDDYLDKNFQYPDEIMNLVKKDAKDEKNKTSTPSISSKQTMPEIIFALCDEALSILNRNAKLGPLQAEILLSMADYTSEWAEYHLRCRWGEGEGCYSGELGDEPRWLKTTVASLQFHELKTKNGEDMIAINGFVRIKQTCELMQQAVSIGSLDPSTRADVALVCINTCIRGIKASSWRGNSVARIQLPRKAAFFSVTLAETLSSGHFDTGQSFVVESWMFSCRMYSPIQNTRDGTGRYGWASLRATILHALSMQGDSTVSQEAARHLLELLGETETQKTSSVFATMNKETTKYHKKAIVDSVISEIRAEEASYEETPSWSQALALQSGEGGDSVDAGPASFASKLKQSFATMTTTYPMLANHAKWASEGSSIPSLLLPMANFSKLANDCNALNCVWTAVEHDKCTAAQKDCVNRINALGRSVAVSSGHPSTLSILHPLGAPELPIVISSAEAIQVEDILELECTKRKVVKKEEGAMSTFFNPFENKRKEVENITRVAEEEERAFLVQMDNKLSIPFSMSRCQLVFDNNEDQRVHSTSLSFLLPPKAKSFTVSFPFTVQPHPETNYGDVPSEMFEVLGIKFVCLGRAIFLPISTTRTTAADRSTLPKSIASYPHQSKRVMVTNEKSKIKSIKLEAFPCQPRLTIIDDEKGAPLTTESELKILVTNSELTDLPRLRIDNYTGPSGKGRVERLQIVAVGVPGVTEKILYDSETQLDGHCSDMNAVDDFILCDQPFPIRLALKDCNIDLAAVNDSSVSSSKASFKLSVATARNATEKLSRDTLFNLRLRYRGRSTTHLDTWRKRDIPVRLEHFRGPRIASLMFSPDLYPKTLFVECCDLLRARKLNRQEEKKDEFDKARKTLLEEMTPLVLASGSFVASSNLIISLMITNPTSADIIVFRDSGPVGGLPGSDMEEVQIYYGVSATIPIALPRFARKDTTFETMAGELAKSLQFRWKTKSSENSNSGRITISAREIQRLLQENPVTIGHLCQPPCCLTLDLSSPGMSLNDPMSAQVRPGQALSLEAKAILSPWVLELELDAYSLAIELFCVRRDKGGRQRGYVWSGKLRGSFKIIEAEFAHKATIMFTESGTFSLSCCARLSSSQSDDEEVWWLPEAREVQVERL